MQFVTTRVGGNIAAIQEYARAFSHKVIYKKGIVLLPHGRKRLRPQSPERSPGKTWLSGHTDNCFGKSTMLVGVSTEVK